MDDRARLVGGGYGRSRSSIRRLGKTRRRCRRKVICLSSWERDEGIYLDWKPPVTTCWPYWNFSPLSRKKYASFLWSSSSTVVFRWTQPRSVSERIVENSVERSIRTVANRSTRFWFVRCRDGWLNFSFRSFFFKWTRLRTRVSSSAFSNVSPPGSVSKRSTNNFFSLLLFWTPS